MIKLRKGYRYTIMYVYSIKEVMSEYPKAKIILLEDKDNDGGSIIAIEEKEY